MILIKFIVFGVGLASDYILEWIGWANVECFCDNFKYGGTHRGKKIISFDELLKYNLEEFIVVVAAYNRASEIERQLDDAGITRYFSYTGDIRELYRVYPWFYYNKKAEHVSYGRSLEAYDLSKYSNIGIIGYNEYIPYLLSDIFLNSGKFNVNKVICTHCELEEFSCIGVPVVNSTKIEKEDFDCIIINDTKITDECVRLVNCNSWEKIIDIYDVDRLEPKLSCPNMRKYKDIHKGKRIWIVGLGSSLDISDLNKLHDNHEICISSNKVHKLYSMTDWRPDYVGLTDYLLIKNSLEEIYKNNIGRLLVADLYHSFDIDYDDRFEYFHLYRGGRKQPRGYKLDFSTDLEQMTYGGYKTVTYDFCMQFARYLGASEIIMIGCDYNYEKDQNHMVKDYYSDAELEKLNKQNHDVQSIVEFFNEVDKYSRENGFRIYNATRGGMIEAFERVDFDSIIGS
ncbi:hypothetical protein [Eubacterium xylanophilum]|uniref:hypothetical protein n=1 Tax=Eubacterium xylanophilum TaxID=39497 RepID=UPI0004AEF36F|nr:hypothetical protein [Eubacterium xylanophilum]